MPCKKNEAIIIVGKTKSPRIKIKKPIGGWVAIKPKVNIPEYPY